MSLNKWHGGKGSDRRKEDTQKVRENLGKIDYSGLPKKPSFKVRINGKSA